MKGSTIVTQYGNSLYYLSLLLALIAVSAIFPFASHLLKQSQNRWHVLDLVNRLNESVGFFPDHNSPMDIDLQLAGIQSPLITLTEVGSISIKEYDHTTIEILLVNLRDNFKKQIELSTNVDLQLLYRSSGRLLQNLFPVACKERNETALNKIVYTRYEIERQTITNIQKIQLHDWNGKYAGWDFNNTIQDLYVKAIQYNEDRTCKEIIDAFRDFIRDIIVSYFPGKFDYDPKTWTTGVDEKSMVTNLLGDANKMVSIAFTAKKFNLMQNITNFFGTLELETIGSNNTRMGKLFILNILNSYKYEVLERYIRENPTSRMEMGTYLFGTMSITQAVSSIQCSIPFEIGLKGMRLVFAEGKLNTMVINSVKAEAFHFIANFNEHQINKKLLIMVITEFQSLGSKILDSDSDSKKDVYIKLSKHLEFIKSYWAETGNQDDDVTKALGLANSSFTNQNKFEKELSDRGYISNDSIV